MKRLGPSFALFLVGLVTPSCSGSSPPPASSSPTLQIVAKSGAPLAALAGDAVVLEVVQIAANGDRADLPASANVTWSLPAAVTALAPESMATSPMPTAGRDPTAAFVAVPDRAERASDLANVVFILDAGTVQNGVVNVTATVAGLGSANRTVNGSIAVAPAPLGDFKRGAALYGKDGANCAACHGEAGEGSAPTAGGSSYVIAGVTYDFPAPGLNAQMGNAAGDSAWNAALFAFAARADVDNGGIALRAPMPDWLTRPNPSTGQPLTTQDFADIFAFLKAEAR